MRGTPAALIVLAGLVTLGACGSSGAVSNPYPQGPGAALNYSNPSHAPKEWVQFCGTYPAACGAYGRTAITLTPALWSLLGDVNTTVNHRMSYTDDTFTAGVTDRWDLLDMGRSEIRGDCEDAALTKKELLIARGVPAGALRLALVHRPVGSGGPLSLDHAVLVVETDQGSFMLDSLDQRMKSVADTRYRFLKVHAPTPADPNHWVWVHGSKQTLP